MFPAAAGSCFQLKKSSYKPDYCRICQALNSRQKSQRSAATSRGLFLQFKSQIFNSGVGGEQTRIKRKETYDLESQLQINANVLLGF